MKKYWATPLKEQLRDGKAVEFRPRGRSMMGLIESGDLVRIIPYDRQELKPGDIVLCRVNGYDYLHKVLKVVGATAEIGNNRGHVNGWASAIYGICTHINGVERDNSHIQAK